MTQENAAGVPRTVSVRPTTQPMPPEHSETHPECACEHCRRLRGCFVVTASDAPLPDGWSEVQRDDSPDYAPRLVHFFVGDVEAARWVSPSARAVSVETGETVRLIKDASGAPYIPAAWCVGHRVRLIVPTLDAIDRGLVEDRPAALKMLRDHGWYCEHDCGGVYRWRRDLHGGRVLLAADETSGEDLSCGTIFVGAYPSVGAIETGDYEQEHRFESPSAFAFAVATDRL